MPSLAEGDVPAIVVPLLLGPSDVSFNIGVPAREGDAAAIDGAVPNLDPSRVGTPVVPAGTDGAGVVSGFVLSVSG